MSCDEAVVKKMGDGILADYTASLLSLATGKHIIAGVPLAFGEGDTKGRIRNLANWKKPAFWVVLIAVILCVVTAVCLLTNPKRNPKDLPTVEQTYLAISSKGEEFDVGLKGHSRDNVIDYWGEPDGMLSGFWGDIWKLNGVVLPKDYIEFMKKHNGGEGDIGSTWLVLYPLEELQDVNDDYEVEKFLPNHVIIGSDGGDEFYGIDSKGNYFNVPIMMDENDITFLGTDIELLPDRINALWE